MTPEKLLNYFDLIQSNKSILYHCNRYSKTLDGNEKVNIKDYPIGKGKIILNEQCPWHEFYYNPYFKKRYFDKIIHQIIDYRTPR